METLNESPSAHNPPPRFFFSQLGIQHAKRLAQWEAFTRGGWDGAKVTFIAALKKRAILLVVREEGGKSEG